LIFRYALVFEGSLHGTVYHCLHVSSLAQDTYAYVTSSDVRNISDFDEQTVVAIKAPSQTKVEISDPDEVLY